MVDYEKPTERLAIGTFYAFDHIEFHVGNAKQAASYYTSRFGFQYVAYQGLETGHRDYCTHLIRNGKILFAFTSPLNLGDKDFSHGLENHGDGVKDVAFHVDDAAGIYNKAVERGAKSVRPPQTLDDENGKVIVSSVQTYGDTVHTFVQRDNYTSPFLPGFIAHHYQEKFNSITPIPSLTLSTMLSVINQTWKWNQLHNGMRRCWISIDFGIHTEYSSLRSVVMADFDEAIKMPINEPAAGKRKSQIQEYVDYYAGAGVQHIAMRTNDIITTVQRMADRVVDFLKVPDTYYENLRKGIQNAGIKVNEDIDALQRLKILVDYDDKGYLLQIFTKPVEDSPTLFFEVIQRHNYQGFGAGNFKSLFEAIQSEQALRGNL